MMSQVVKPEPDATQDDMLRAVVAAAEARKAEDLKVLDVATLSDFTDYFVLASGTNERQVQAIVDAILDVLAPMRIKPLHVEGYDHARWVLVDFGGDMVIHVFLDQARVFYGLERLWADAEDVTERLRSEPTS
ncbi:MAG: ribosome silencing factor [Acidobacteriota bacterium]